MAKAKPVKKSVKKSAPKKTAPARKASKSSAKKVAPKKPLAVKKASVKKPAAKPAPKKKAPAKKPAVKAPAKKAIVKKQAPKKNLPKKSAAKKPAPAKKPVAKVSAKKAAPAKAKSAPKKAVAKPVVKSAAPVAKKSAPQKAEPKKAQPKVDIKEIISKKLGAKPKKAEAVAVPEVAGRASADVHFTMDDLFEYLASKGKGEEKSGASSSSKELLKKQKSAALKLQAVPKKPMAAASIADILGFNPMSETRAHFEEKDVPQKWKKYYKLLIEVKTRLAGVAQDMSDVVAPAKEELTHEQAIQGMDAADIGSKNFERDMAYSLLSNEQAILEEVDAAIERMRDGTYGVCEITGKPIPESRLVAIPWARCTIEGQRQKEAEQKKQKSGGSRNPYGDIADDMDELEVFEDADE